MAQTPVKGGAGPRAPGPSRFDVTPNANTHFAWLRTRLATERTMMAWLRTGVALIGFGFTIFQFVEKFNTTPGVRATAHPHAPQILGLMLIGAGIVSLAVAAHLYRGLNRYLWGEEFAAVAGTAAGGPVKTPMLVVTIIVILAGLFAFLAVLLRLE